MLFRNKRFQETTAKVVIACLLWLTGGGELWAQRVEVKNDPTGYLARMADNPRLALDPQQRAALRAALESEAASRGKLGRLERRSIDRGSLHSERRIALESRDLAEEIDALLTPTATAASEAEGALAEPASVWLPDERTVADVESRFERLHARNLEDFAAVDERLRGAGIDGSKLARHAAAREAYADSAASVRADLAIARSGEARSAAEALRRAAETLRSTTDERAHVAYDPSRMPFRAAEPVYSEPGSERGAETERLEAPPVRSLSEVKPVLEKVTTSKAAPSPADLAPTEDVQITPEIEALAASLGNQPLAIFDWVRNHVDFYPTWGSVQGSQMTLDARRGNAFDQASLLIALLRASGIAARYVTGTVQIDADEVRNWVGGAPTASVAQQVLGIGGISNVGILIGGSVELIRLDHVWVEAYIDNIPSRGAVQREGDTWLPMDPSFKLHTFEPLSDVFTDVPFSGAVDSSTLPFTVDESLGKITDFDSETFDQQIIDWLTASDEYLVANGLGAADQETVFGAVVGGQSIVEETSTIFAASLPYAVVSRDGALSDLPAGLRHSVRLEGFGSSIERALGSPSFVADLSLPALNSRRLGIRFEPSTPADADVIDNAIASGASSLPVYLVDVTPSVQLDGVEIARGSSLGMGKDYFVDVVLRSPGRSNTIPYRVVAGDEIVVGITGNGFAPGVIEKRFEGNPVDTSPEYLHQVQLHYWAQSDQLGGIAARGLGVLPLRLPSVGFFSSPLTVSYFFGTPRTGVYQSRVMDVQQSLVGGAAVDDAAVAEWVKQSGHYGSYLEGSVFEQLDSANSATPVVAGISSIHLIAAAASQGVPIYYITQANRATVLPLLQLSSAVEADVSSAVAQGQTALVPERNIDLGPWRGVGYILQDETTGAGAYLISGGAAGGGLLDCLEELLPRLVEVLEFVLYLILFLIILGLLIAAIAGSGGTLAPAGAAAAVFFFFLLFRHGASPTTAPTTA